MEIRKKDARRWAKVLIQEHMDFEYSLVYEDEDILDEYPNEEDWKAIYSEMTSARIEVIWDD